MVVQRALRGEIDLVFRLTQLDLDAKRLFPHPLQLDGDIAVEFA